MKLLINFNKFNEYLDLESGDTYEVDRLAEFCGEYVVFGETISAIYVLEKQIYLRFGDLVYQIKDRMTVELNETVTYVTIKLYSEDKIVIAEFTYPKEEVYTFNTPPFEYIDKENEDWGTFISNIVNSKARKDQIIIGWGHGQTR